MALPKPNRRHFTEAARVAAMEARRRKREEREAAGRDCPEVFVVREPEFHLRFVWEIRRFGGIVLDRSSVVYPRVGDARSAGELALSHLVGATR